MDLAKSLYNIELLNGLTDEELAQVASICHERQLHIGEILARQGEPGDELYIVTQGLVEVVLQDDNAFARQVVVNLGEGQIIGEMSLIDQGTRSATLRAVSQQTTIQVIRREDFDRLLQQNTHIGFIVMRNIATDLSFKLRHRNLSSGGR